MVVFIMALCGICGVTAMLWQVRCLSVEVGFLPQAHNGAQNSPIHPLVGINVRHYLSLPTENDQKAMVIMFASPTCPPCHEELEKLLVEYEGSLAAFLCIARFEDGETPEGHEGLERFKIKYGELVRIVHAPDKILTEMQIDEFPTVALINSLGEVIQVGRPAMRLLRLLDQKGGQSE